MINRSLKRESEGVDQAASDPDVADPDVADGQRPPVESAPLENASLEIAPLEIAQLIHEHHQDIYRYAFRLTGQQADAEDVTQQTFLIAHGKLHQVRDPAKVRGWLFAILRSCYLKSKRKKQPVAAGAIALDIDHIPQSVDDDKIDRTLLQSAVNRLPDEFKLVVVMYYFEQASYKEIAESLQIPIGTVMSRLSRAKSRLRGMLLTSEAPT